MLIQKWHPVTHDMGLIDASPGGVLRELLAWHSSIGIEHDVREIHSLEDGLEGLLPLSISHHRRLLVPTRSGWTAYFATGIQGSDPFPVMSELAKRAKARSMRVCATPDDARYPATIWEVYDSDSPGPLSTIRTICCANDGGRWVFETSGDPLPFEQEGSYRAPRKRDRFTREVLDTYLAEWRLRPFDDEFYSPSLATPGYLLQQATKAHSSPGYTLGEVVAGKPWSRPT